MNTDVSASGACGAKCIQAASASLACAHGQLTVNQAARRAGAVRSVNEVTMPKLPPPPPRQAQKRSS